MSLGWHQIHNGEAHKSSDVNTLTRMFLPAARQPQLTQPSLSRAKDIIAGTTEELSGLVLRMTVTLTSN